MSNQRQHHIGTVIMVSGIVVPGFILCCIIAFETGTFEHSAAFPWLMWSTAALFPLSLIIGACFWSRAAGHPWTTPIKPWAWWRLSTVPTVRELPRDHSAASERLVESASTRIAQVRGAPPG